MNDCKDKSKCLASLAVFREFYNSKKDVYGVISEFLKEIILSEAKHQFTLTEITKLLDTSFDFQLPEAIVKTALKRLDFVNKKGGTYSADNLANEKRTKISEVQKRLQANNSIIIEQLFTYIQKNQKIELTENQKEKIVHSLCSFLLDESNKYDYSEFVSAFVISKQKEINFKTQLNNIKEGVVLYSGIKYNSNINKIGGWVKPLTIYIDTEILFHFAGYNGELYKTLFFALLSLIKEINIKSDEKIIHLKYFKEVKIEIENFFKKAEYIIEGREIVNPSGTAMPTILNGCKTQADIIIKKAQFFELLNKAGIREDDYDGYFDKENHKYNIIDKTIIDKFLNEFKIEDIEVALKFLSYINVHRKGLCEDNFENIKFILLTGKKITLKIARDNDIKSQKHVPLATDLDFITNKFWFKLNKGFGKSDYPKTFDIVTKAQIILSTQLNEAVSAKYDELQNKYKKGELTESQAIAAIAEFRSQARKPEDIKENDISIILYSISEDTMEKYIEEQAHFKNKADKEAEENIKLKEDLHLKEEEMKEKELRYKKDQIELKKDSKKKLLDEKIQTRDLLEEQKAYIDKEASNKLKSFKIKTAVILLCLYIILCFIIWKFGWSSIEPLLFILGLIPTYIPVFILLFTEKNIDKFKYLKNKKRKIYETKYKHYNFDINRLEKIKSEINELTEEITCLKME